MKKPQLLDFAMLMALGLMWGSAFLFIELALASFEPFSLTALRISFGAVTLWLVALLKGHRLPRDRATWLRVTTIGFLGLVMPFILISWAQQGIESSRAAILMAFTPLTTLMMAHVMTRDEKLTPGLTAGLVLGFAGVFLLLGGTALGDFSMVGSRQLAVLLATLGYAVSAIMMRNLSHISPTSGSTAIMVAASIMAIPLALMFGSGPIGEITILSAGSMLILGVFPSALATVVMIQLINRVGVTFASMSSYLIPVVGVILGAFLLNEEITTRTGGAFALILSGVALASIAARRRAQNES